MKYPELCPRWLCKTQISIVIEDESLDENGAPIELFSGTLLCNYQDGGRRKLPPSLKDTDISGTALFNGDICPEIPNITGGHATVNGMEREIVQGRKNRNPDGTVNFTEIWLK